MGEEKLSASDQFEKELDDFFQERALFRAQNVTDGSKTQVSKLRDEEGEPLDNGMSGCCMTGCHDCPWGYEAPAEACA